MIPFCLLLHLLITVTLGEDGISYEISRRFERELFYPAPSLEGVNVDFVTYVGGNGFSANRDTYFSGIEHEMYVTTGPFHENMSGHVNEGVHHASRPDLVTKNSRSPETFFMDLKRIHGSLAARLFCTHHMIHIQQQQQYLENSFLCDWSARRSIAAWRYYHLCKNNMFPCDSPIELARDTPWFNLLVHQQKQQHELKDGVDTIAASMCEYVLGTSEGRELVKKARFRERLQISQDESELGATCRALTSTVMYAKMEQKVSFRMGYIEETYSMRPDPAVRVRRLEVGVFPSRGEWSQLDVERISWVRANVERFVVRTVGTYCRNANMFLEVGPQDWGLMDPFRSTIGKIETMDIDPNSDTTYSADITKRVDVIEDARFDCVLFTEVLEHTVEPWNALREIERILKPGGILIMSTPLNLRLHGPSPDAWRITEYGYRTSLTQTYKFELIELNAMEDRKRLGLPVHHTVVARRRELGFSDHGDL